ncbi:hypothetical protein IJJ18_03055 [Candidatus Saccharibacteria bacterium]|nr:hypothetical protein [Candidatus Saccharibacteria bacterium]
MFDMENVKKPIRPRQIIWDASNVSRVKLGAVLGAGSLPPGTFIKLNRTFFDADDDMEDIKAFVDFCEEQGYLIILEVNLPEIDPDAITPNEAFEAGAASIMVSEALTGDDPQGALTECIGANYGRIIENIQMGK